MQRHIQTKICKHYYTLYSTNSKVLGKILSATHIALSSCEVPWAGSGRQGKISAAHDFSMLQRSTGPACMWADFLLFYISIHKNIVKTFSSLSSKHICCLSTSLSPSTLPRIQIQKLACTREELIP